LREKFEMLKLGKYEFTLDEGSKENFLWLCSDDKGNKAWNLELHFSEGEYDGETVLPMIILNYIKTKKQSPEELKNESFKVGSLEDCEEREDEFYIFEHEPMLKYAVKIKDVKDGKALVSCTGTAVEDGYAEKPKKVKFSLEEWVKIEDMEVNEDFSDDEEEAPVPSGSTPVKFIPYGGGKQEDLAKAEELAGFTFPDDLRQFLLEQNGANLINIENHLILPAVKEKLKVIYLYSITKNNGVHSDNIISTELTKYRLYIPQQMVPIARLYAGRCLICYSNMDKYKGVYGVDILKNFKETKKNGALYKIADTFTEFLTKIVVDE